MKSNIYNFFFYENRAVYEITWKNMVVRQTTDGNITRRMLDRHTQNMKYFLLLHDKYGYANRPQCYAYRHIACLLSSITDAA
jgi:hypothetical protein